MGLQLRTAVSFEDFPGIECCLLGGLWRNDKFSGRVSQVSDNNLPSLM